MHVFWLLELHGSEGGSRSLDLQHPTIGAGLLGTPGFFGFDRAAPRGCLHSCQERDVCLAALSLMAWVPAMGR